MVALATLILRGSTSRSSSQASKHRSISTVLFCAMLCQIAFDYRLPDTDIWQASLVYASLSILQPNAQVAAVLVEALRQPGASNKVVEVVASKKEPERPPAEWFKDL